jgi:hypothetical protein
MPAPSPASNFHYARLNIRQAEGLDDWINELRERAAKSAAEKPAADTYPNWAQSSARRALPTRKTCATPGGPSIRRRAVGRMKDHPVSMSYAKQAGEGALGRTLIT